MNSLQAKSAKVIVSSQTPDNPYDVGFGASRFVGYAQTAAEVRNRSNMGKGRY